MRVVFDANALMTPSQHNVDVFDEAERILGGYDAVVPDAVLRELRALADDGNADASVAVELAERCEEVETEARHGDDAVIEATDEESAVVTNDAKLKERLVERNVPVLYLRQRNRLEAEYP